MVPPQRRDIVPFSGQIVGSSKRIGAISTVPHRGPRLPKAWSTTKAGRLGDNIAQQFEAFASRIGALVRQAGDVATGSRQTGTRQSHAPTASAAPLPRETK
jgi:hypothetical protein